MDPNTNKWFSSVNNLEAPCGGYVAIKTFKYQFPFQETFNYIYKSLRNIRQLFT